MMKYLPSIFLFCILFFNSVFAESKEVHYSLDIASKAVNYSGAPIEAMVINDSIPGPVLEFTEGDVAVITVKNHTKGEASIHWHGLLLPQDQDGVPYLTQFPIPSGEEYYYQFPLTHAGTYWYHSHTRIDEQRGQYGAIIVHPKSGYTEAFDHDVVVQLSDWTDEDPHQVLKNLKKDGDWYAYKKNSVISLKGYLDSSSLSAWASNRWQRMEGMDVSDVGYDAFLANGKTYLELLPEVKAGERVRVRLINSGASSIFDIQQNTAPFEVITADGVDVKPVMAEKFRISMAETYDVIVTIPDSGAYQFAANNIDGSGGVKITIGSGQFVEAPEPKRPNLFVKMDHGNHGHHDNHTGHSSHSIRVEHKGHERHGEDENHQNHSNKKMESHNKHHYMHKMHHNHQPKVLSVLDYGSLQAREPVVHHGELQEFTLRLTGDMESYNWSFNDLPLSKADAIKIDRGKVVRFHFVNDSMMNHPLHLHGHFFKVLTGNGDHDVIKHTVNVAPMGNVTIEFAANEEKDWFFHCHNLYHAKTGMARVVRYSDYDGNPAFTDAKKNSNEIMDNDWYMRADLGLYSQYSEGRVRLSNSDYSVELSAEEHYDEERELLTHVNYKASRWLQYFVGVELEKELDELIAEHDNTETEWLVGAKWVAPFSIETALWITDDGDVHSEFETEFHLNERWNLELGASTESEWEAVLEYRRSPYWSAGVSVNNVSGVGVGVALTF